MVAKRLIARLASVATFIAILACHDVTGPRQPRTAVTYVRQSPLALVVSSPDGKQIYTTYALPFSPLGAELSPDRSQILLPNNIGEIWIVSTSDGQSRMIVSRYSGPTTPSWTPDGKHIVFCQSTGGVWMMNPDGSNAHAIGSGPPAYAPELEPVLSQDGSRIAFNSPSGSPGGTGPYHVYTMNADGSGAALLSIPAGNTRGDAWDPAWSPDGRQLVFARWIDTTSAVWIANVDGSGARPITAGEDVPWTPTWSPNGDAVAFAVNAKGGGYIAVVDIATGATTQLRSGTTGSIGSEWSPHWIRWP